MIDILAIMIRTIMIIKKRMTISALKMGIGIDAKKGRV